MAHMKNRQFLNKKYILDCALSNVLALIFRVRYLPADELTTVFRV